MVKRIISLLFLCTAATNAAFADAADYQDDSMGCGVKFVTADNRPMQCSYPMGSFIFFNDPDIFESNNNIYIPGMTQNQELVPEPEFEQQQSEFLN